jgi:hypothetical protein
MRREENKDPRFAEYVFHRDEEPVGDFRKAWATACKLANVSTRCSTIFAAQPPRNMIEAGVQQAVAMKISGHKTDAVFRRCAILNED